MEFELVWTLATSPLNGANTISLPGKDVLAKNNDLSRVSITFELWYGM
jgi:hypothetical protein